MTNHEIVITTDNLPAFMRTVSLTGNEEAMASLSLGGFPYIKLNGTRFMAVEGDREVTLPVMELPVVIMRAARELRKKWYATKFNPNSPEPNKKPDCFSDDGITPHGTSTSPQAKTCASCPHNAFGSGRDQDGKPTDGKACSDNKQLAVYSRAPSQTPVPANMTPIETSVFGLRLPPASLKNFAVYVKAMTAKGVPLAGALTIIGFDPAYTYPVLSFRFGGLLNDAQYAAIDAMAKGEEVATILAPTPGAAVAVATPVQSAAPPAAQAGSVTVADLGLDVTPVVQPAVQPAVPEVVQPTAVVQPAAPPPSATGDIFGDLLPTAQTAAPVATASAPVTETSDDALARELGLV